MSIRSVDEHLGIVCDFCQEHLKEQGLTVVTDTHEEAELLAQFFNWFSEEGKHYCTKCVPVGQEVKESTLVGLYKMLLPGCSLGNVLVTVGTVGIVLAALFNAAFIVALVGLIAYGLHVRLHYVTHQRNEALHLLLNMIEETEEKPE